MWKLHLLSESKGEVKAVLFKEDLFYAVRLWKEFSDLLSSHFKKAFELPVKSEVDVQSSIFCMASVSVLSYFWACC